MKFSKTVSIEAIKRRIKKSNSMPCARSLIATNTVFFHLENLYKCNIEIENLNYHK